MTVVLRTVPGGHPARPWAGLSRLTKGSLRCFAPGSQGIINPPAIEETTHRLGELTALGWVARNVTEPEKFGLAPDSLEIIVQLKNGERLSMAFGTELPKANTALAAVTFGDERWAFVFPPVLYQFVTSYLTIPANAP